MCLPLLPLLAAATLATTAVGVGLTVAGQAKAASAARDQATLNAQTNARQAQLANEGADRAISYGQQNADLTTAMAGINNQITSSVAGWNTKLNDAVTTANDAITGATTAANIKIIDATTDFNVGAIAATTNFNVTSAEGAASLLEAQGKLQHEAHDANATYADRQADDALDAGHVAEQQSRGQYGQLKGQQRAALAANGVALDEGSALRLQSDTEYLADKDADTIRTNAIKTALGFRVTAINERSAGTLAELSSDAAAMGEHAKAVGARVSGMAGIASAYASGTVAKGNQTINGATTILQNDIDGTMKDVNTNLTASMQMLQTSANAAINARNDIVQSQSDAWTLRAQGEGYTGQSIAAKATAASINPLLTGITAGVNGVAKLTNQAYGFAAAGAFG